MNLRTKMNLFQIAIVLASIIVMASIFIHRMQSYSENEIEQYRVQTMSKEKERLRDLVQTAYGMVEIYYKEDQSGDVRADTQAKVLARIAKIRLSDGNYFWINDMDMKMVMHPEEPALNGKDLSGFTDEHGKYLFREMVAACREKGEGFVSYWWAKPGKEGAFPKLSHVKLFKPWGWVIGMGVYVDEIDEAVAAKRQTANNLLRTSLILVSVVSLILAVAAIAASMLFSRSIIKALGSEPAVLSNIAEKVTKGDLSLSFDKTENKSATGVYAAIKKIPETLNEVTGQMNEVAQEIAKGNLLMRGDPARLAGDFAALIKDNNTLLDELVGYIDNMPAPVFSIDKDFNLLYINNVGAELAGMTPKEAIGKRCFELFKTSDCQTENCACARAMKTAQKQKSETDAHPGGMELEIEYIGVPNKDAQGNVVGAYEIILDQTAIKTAQKKMTQIAGE
ncbi:MAG: cache domain-containing protein, partial [Thermodesulfobacteriota bacterium]|nr:cache domain-containing protein [Thermodesulfobacteriota bacterium]